MSTTAPSAAPVGTWAALRTMAADIKLAHSVFALPFAVLAAIMAAADAAGDVQWARFARQLALIVALMVLARTWAMLANRLFDRHLDADNPRTAGRALPSGRLDERTVRRTMAWCGAAFLAGCLVFGASFGNWWPSVLGLPVLAWLAAYGFTKRFTSLCHLWLGASLAISPLAAALAVDPAAIAARPALWCLSAMVLLWVAGFDVIYALQDVDVDRRQGLHSIPVRLGPVGARWASRAMHVGAMACLAGVWLLDERLGWPFGAGVIGTGGLLLVEQATVARWGTTRIALTFFTLNGLIACLLGVVGAADVLLVR